MGARYRTATLTAQDTFTPPIALKRGGIITLKGTWAGTVSLMRYDQTTDAYIEATNNNGAPIQYTNNGTYGIDPYDFGGIYKIGFQTGDYVSGSLIAIIEGR